MTVWLQISHCTVVDTFSHFLARIPASRRSCSIATWLINSSIGIFREHRVQDTRVLPGGGSSEVALVGETGLHRRGGAGGVGVRSCTDVLRGGGETRLLLVPAGLRRPRAHLRVDLPVPVVLCLGGRKERRFDLFESDSVDLLVELPLEVVFRSPEDLFFLNLIEHASTVSGESFSGPSLSSLCSRALNCPVR